MFGLNGAGMRQHLGHSWELRVSAGLILVWVRFQFESQDEGVIPSKRPGTWRINRPEEAVHSRLSGSCMCVCECACAFICVHMCAGAGRGFGLRPYARMYP